MSVTSLSSALYARSSNSGDSVLVGHRSERAACTAGSAVNSPNALNTPGDGGTTTRLMPSSTAAEIACSGPLPPYAQSLFRSTQIKLRAAQLGIRKIDAGATSGYIVFEENNRIDAKRVLKLIQGRQQDYRLDGPLKLRFSHDARTEENLFTRIELLLELLS